MDNPARLLNNGHDGLGVTMALRILKYVGALVGGIVLSFTFTEVIPLLVLGEGAINSQLAIAAILGVAVLAPGLFVGWLILRRWPEALLVMVITGVVTFAAHALGLVVRPWPTVVAPVVAVLASVIVHLMRPTRQQGQPR